MEREPLSASGLVDILSAKPTLSADWNTFSLLAADTPLHAAASFAETALGLYVSGRHRIRRELGRRSVEGWSDPGATNLSPRAWRQSGKLAHPREPLSCLPLKRSWRA
jgi:hypothetical protein